MTRLLKGIGKLAVAGLGLALLPASPPATATDPGVRAPAVAGQFYPGDAGKLEGAIRAFLADARPPRPARPLALVCPHAGYAYSGQIAADAYRQAEGRDYDVVVILGANHTDASLRDVSVYTGSGYRTPLGVAKIDAETVERLLAADPAFVSRPEAHAREHSVEVQVPFVQVALPGVSIVAAVVGESTLDRYRRLGAALAAALRGRRPLIVASSDLSHYPDHEDAAASDGAFLKAVVSLDAKAVEDAIGREMRRGRPGLVTCACGEAPVLVAMEAARALGATGGALISYANSGDTLIGERSRVVGYGAVVLACGETGTEALPPLEPPPPERTVDIGPADGKALVVLAREAIRRFLATDTVPLPRNASPALGQERGVFVTLKVNGELRGCRGQIDPHLPLYLLVGQIALQSAFNDQRFLPVRAEELDRITIDVSLLTPPVEIKGVEDIVLGRDGVILEKGGRSALFLPEVAVEQGWDREAMLEALCEKAGLPAGAWRKGARFQTFRTQVLCESDLL